MHDETLESVSGDLAEAGDLLDAARKALERLQVGDQATIRHAASRIERMAAEVARIERELARQAVGQ